MTKNKPDRWERMVEKAMHRDGLGAQYVSPAKALKLLSQQHRAVVALINNDIRTYKKIVADASVTADDYTHAHAAWTALASLLYRIKKRAT